MADNTDKRGNVYDILKGFSTAMVVTHGLDGKHRARPMHIAELDQQAGQVRFLTGHGAFADEVQKESGVLLVFENENSAYLSLRGKARIERDKDKVKAIWKEPYKVWFPQGPGDPEIVLVEVDLTEAEYWDNRGMNKLEYLFEAAKAYVKGQKPDVKDEEQHAKATL